MLSGKFECVRPVSCAKTKRLVHIQRSIESEISSMCFVVSGWSKEERVAGSANSKIYWVGVPPWDRRPLLWKILEPPWSKMLFVLSWGSRGATPARAPSIFLILCSFLEKIRQICMLGSPLGVGAPSYGESCILPWLLLCSSWKNPTSR